MDSLTKLLDCHRPQAKYLFSGQICGQSPMNYDGEVGYIHILLQGRLTVFLQDGTAQFLDKPSLVFYPTKRPHDLVGDPKDPAHMVCATIECSGGNPISRFLPSFLVLPLADHDSVRGCATLLEGETNERSMGWLGATDGIFSYLLTLVIRHAISTGKIDKVLITAASCSRLAKGLAAIHDHPERDWTVSSLARECAMSRSKFARRFHDLTGITPIDYLTRCRLTSAKEMLSRGEPIKVAAAMTGFSSPSAFTRAFARCEGQPPMAWMESHQRHADDPSCGKPNS